MRLHLLDEIHFSKAKIESLETVLNFEFQFRFITELSVYYIETYIGILRLRVRTSYTYHSPKMENPTIKAEFAKPEIARAR